MLTKNDLFKKGIKDTLFYALSILLGRALTILVIPYLAIILTLEEIAFYDLFLIGTNYVQLFLTLGIDSGIAIKIADHKDNKEKLRFYFSISMLIVVLMTVLLGVLGVPIVLMISTYQVDFLFLLALQGFLMAIQYIAFNYFKWLGESKKASVLMSIGYGLGVVIGVGFIVFIKATLLCFLLGVVIGNIIGVIITCTLSFSYIKMKFDKNTANEVKLLLKLSLPFFFNSLLNQSYKATDRFIILYFLNAQILGIYSMIIRLCQIPVMAIEVALNAFQAITFLNYKNQKGIELYNKILNINFISINILLVLITGVFYFGIPLIPSLVDIHEYIYLIPLIFFNISFLSIRMYGGFSYFIHNKTIYITYITLGALVTYILLSILLINIGIIGVAISGAIVSVISCYFYFYIAYKIQSFNENMNRILGLSVLSMVVVIIITMFLN